MKQQELREYYDAQLATINSRIEKTDSTLKEMGKIGNRVEVKVINLGKSMYLFMGTIIFINFLWVIPKIGEMLL